MEGFPMKISDLRSLIDRAVLESLRQLDVEEAERVRRLGCLPCGGRLHQANYPRKPRGIEEVAEEDRWRLSFCCEECRCRTTPKSARFLGRKVYFAVVVIVAMVLRATTLVRCIAAATEASALTIRRWVKWWDGPVLGSNWWREVLARVTPPPDEAAPVRSLYERFLASAPDTRTALTRLLSFTSPLTVPGKYPC
jgi:hypothetical protein